MPDSLPANLTLFAPALSVSLSVPTVCVSLHDRFFAFLCVSATHLPLTFRPETCRVNFSLTVALSVMSGFEIDLRGRLLAFTPQVTIERTDGGVWNPADLEKKIAAMPGVVAAAPYVTSQVMAVGSTPSGAITRTT